MGRKIFVSYKYADYDVKNLNYWTNSKVRDYVTEFEKILDSTDHIYKGESDDEDLNFKSKLSYANSERVDFGNINGNAEDILRFSDDLKAAMGE